MKNAALSCDVIIPVFNNARQLPATISSLQNQSLPAGWAIKIILADDGSTDNSLALAEQLCQTGSWPYQIISAPHAGAAAARNCALTQSSSPLVLFLGADIALRPGALLAHLNLHSRYPDESSAGLGFVVWDPRLRPNPLMAWMVHGGSQNNFDELLGQTQADPNHFFYGSNLSLKRSLLPPHPFSLDYYPYGWEDIDLGHRLAAAGRLKLHVLPNAVGLHCHYYTAPQIFRRQQAIGFSFRAFQSHYPSSSALAAGTFWHKLKHKAVCYSGLLLLLSRITQFISTRWSFPSIYKLAIDSHFWQGFYHTYPHK